MPNPADRHSVARRARRLSKKERRSAVRFQELRDALARCASEDITPYEWAKVRAELVTMLEACVESSGERAAFLDAIAEVFDERHTSRRHHSD